MENQTRDLVTYPARCESAHCGRSEDRKKSSACGGCVFAKNDRTEKPELEMISQATPDILVVEMF